MRPKIGLISSQTLIGPVHTLTQSAGLDCDIDALEYERMSDLPRIYAENRDRYDGFCITGSVAKEVVQRARGKDSKPLYSISGHSLEYYQEFFRLIEENRAIDLSRIMLDSYLWLGGGLRTAEDFLHRRVLIEKKQEEVIHTLPVERLLDADQRILDNARSAWEQGELDLVVCRFSTAFQILQKANIPCSFVYPDADNILDTLTLLLNEIKLEQLSGNLPAVLYLSSPSFQDSLAEISADSVGIQKCLLEFDHEYTTGFLIKRAPGGFEIYTTMQILQRITEGLSSCQLRKFIFSRLGLEINVGYGVGRDIMQARSNALEAYATAQRSNHSFALLQNGSLLGPLDAKGTRSVSAVLSEKVQLAADRSGLSTATIQRILSVAELLGRSQLTTHDLATALQVTTANANRFLNALVKGGQAQIISEKKSSSKGRPSRVYQLNFLE